MGNRIHSVNQNADIIDRSTILDFTYNEDGLYIEVSPNSDNNIDLAFKELTRKIINSSR